MALGGASAVAALLGGCEAGVVGVAAAAVADAVDSLLGVGLACGSAAAADDDEGALLGVLVFSFSILSLLALTGAAASVEMAEALAASPPSAVSSRVGILNQSQEMV